MQFTSYTHPIAHNLHCAHTLRYGRSKGQRIWPYIEKTSAAYTPAIIDMFRDVLVNEQFVTQQAFDKTTFVLRSMKLNAFGVAMTTTNCIDRFKRSKNHVITDYRIELSWNQSIARMALTVAHELRHIMQRINGEHTYVDDVRYWRGVRERDLINSTIGARTPAQWRRWFAPAEIDARSVELHWASLIIDKAIRRFCQTPDVIEENFTNWNRWVRWEADRNIHLAVRYGTKIAHKCADLYSEEARRVTMTRVAPTYNTVRLSC